MKLFEGYHFKKKNLKRLKMTLFNWPYHVTDLVFLNKPCVIRTDNCVFKESECKMWAMLFLLVQEVPGALELFSFFLFFCFFVQDTIQKGRISITCRAMILYHWAKVSLYRSFPNALHEKSILFFFFFTFLHKAATFLTYSYSYDLNDPIKLNN